VNIALDLGRVGAGVHRCGELLAADDPQAVLVDRVDVGFHDVVGPDLDVVELAQVGGEEAAHGAAADYADPHLWTATFHEASFALINR
jgi:hypothetical protein